MSAASEMGDTRTRVNGSCTKDAHAEIRALVARAQAGETAAFGAIYGKYAGLVFGFVYSRTGDRYVAEDITSDTFLRAIKRIESFTYQGHDLSAWLFTIARNLIADYYKSPRHRLEVCVGEIWAADTDRSTLDGLLDAEAVVISNFTNKGLCEAIRQLTKDQYECVVLRYIRQLPIAEVAQILGKNESAVKALSFRAIRTLRRLSPSGAISWQC